jgi:hypothetical protein
LKLLFFLHFPNNYCASDDKTMKKERQKMDFTPRLEDANFF